MANQLAPPDTCGGRDTILKRSYLVHGLNCKNACQAEPSMIQLNSS